MVLECPPHRRTGFAYISSRNAEKHQFSVAPLITATFNANSCHDLHLFTYARKYVFFLLLFFFYLINSRFFNESGRLSRQQAVRGHDEDLIGASLLQDLCGSDKFLHVVNDVILGHIQGRRHPLSERIFKLGLTPSSFKITSLNLGVGLFPLFFVKNCPLGRFLQNVTWKSLDFMEIKLKCSAQKALQNRETS